MSSLSVVFNKYLNLFPVRYIFSKLCGTEDESDARAIAMQGWPASKQQTRKHLYTYNALACFEFNTPFSDFSFTRSYYCQPVGDGFDCIQKQS
jgi:hypothetical protein